MNLQKVSVVKPQVVNSLGEVVRDEIKMDILQDVSCRFRTISDLKGYDDDEVISEPSDTDVSGYVDGRVVIRKIMENVPLDIMRIYTERAFKDDGSDFGSEDDIQDDFYDDVDDLDKVTISNGIAEAIAEAQSKNDKSNPSVEPKDDKQSAEDAGKTE